MSTLVLRGFFGGSVGAPEVGWEEGAFGGQERKPLSASAPWTVPVGELTPVLSTGAQVG